MLLLKRASILFFVAWGLLGGCGNSPEKTAEHYYQEGLRLRSNRRFQEALQYFQAAVGQSSEHIGAQLELGILLCRYGEYAQCIKHLLKAHELAPQESRAASYLGYAYQQRRNWRLAESYYTAALQLAPNLADVRQYLTDVLERQGKLEQAAQTLQALLDYNPKYARAAIVHARIATFRQPENPETHVQLADAHVRGDEIEQGLHAYRRAVPNGSDDGELFARFGVFCAERQQFAAAATYLTHAIEQGRNDDAELWWWLATSYDALGDMAAAIEAYRAVLAYQPDYAGVRQHVVALLEQNNQPAEAADLLEQDVYAGRRTDVNAVWEQILRLRGEDSQKAVVQLTQAGHDEFLVNVVVDAGQTATFLLDPQSEYTIISEELAEQLKILLSANTSVVHFSYRGQRHTPYLVNLSSVMIGQLAVRNVKTLVLDLSDVTPPIDGVLGGNFLKHFDTRIEREHHLFVLTKP